jgi:AcrR family transcriptional regulator
MPRLSDKRERLVAAADRLFHEKGYERSTIGDVAGAAEVPPGNVYYYFKTKEALLSAVVAARNARIGALLQEMEAEGPAMALERFIRMFEEDRKIIARRGCPVGGLCQEGSRLGGLPAEEAVSTMKLMLDWLDGRFLELGLGKKAAHAEAASLLARLQGASLLAQTLLEAKVLKAEAKRLRAELPHASRDPAPDARADDG